MALSNGAVRLFRNNVGRLEDKSGRWVSFGLCEGSSDLVGYKTVKITAEMVGRDIAVFVAIECKTHKGKLSSDQTNFLLAIRAAGGISGVARSVSDAESILL